MKTIFLFPLLIFLILLAGCNTTSDSTSSSSSAPAMKSGDSNKATLTIEYDESQMNFRPTRYNTINNEQDRFYYLEHNFEKVLGKELGDYNLDFQLYPAEVPENEPVLELTFLSLDSPSPIELELRIWAILKHDGKENDFGVTRSRIVPQRPMTSGSIERDLDAIYTDAANQIVKLLAGEL